MIEYSTVDIPATRLPDAIVSTGKIAEFKFHYTETRPRHLRKLIASSSDYTGPRKKSKSKYTRKKGKRK